MFTLLLAGSTVVTQELYLDKKTMFHVYVIVNRIYGSYTRVIQLFRERLSNKTVRDNAERYYG